VWSRACSLAKVKRESNASLSTALETRPVTVLNGERNGARLALSRSLIPADARAGFYSTAGRPWVAEVANVRRAVLMVSVSMRPSPLVALPQPIQARIRREAAIAGHTVINPTRCQSRDALSIDNARDRSGRPVTNESGPQESRVLGSRSAVRVLMRLSWHVGHHKMT